MGWIKSKHPEEKQKADTLASEPPNAPSDQPPTEAPDSSIPTNSIPTKRSTRLGHLGWLLVGLLWALPTILLVAAGSLWLWEKKWFWPWLVLTGVVSLLGWFLAQWLRRKSRDTWGILVNPDPRWTPQDQAAWEKVEQLAVRLQQSNLPLDQPEPILQAFYEVLATVARHYRPESDRPELEIPAPHVLRIVELVASDLRQILTHWVPGVHWLTLHDFYKLSRLANWFQRFYRWFYGGYRITQLATNPAAAFVREFRDVALGQVQTSTTEELKDGVISFCVRQTGRYAIQLYSGKVLLEGPSNTLPPTRTALRQVEQTTRQNTLLEEEPLRMLVLGSVDSGKNLLVHILWGLQPPPKTSWWKKRFQSKPIPRRLWQPEGFPPVLVADWPDSPHTDPSPKLRAWFEKEILQTDLILLVCAADPSTWTVDRQWMDLVRTIYQQHPERNRPAVVVVLTGIDSAQERSPHNASSDWPGDPTSSPHLQAYNLRIQLGLADTEPVVSLWLNPGQQEEIQKKVIETLQQVRSEAERARYARYYLQYHREERWPRVWEQIRRTGPQAGKVLARQPYNLLEGASKALWHMGTRWFRKRK